MCCMGTRPPHQCGLAENSAPVVGSRLSTIQGPVPITSVPGFPKVPLWSSANFASKISALYDAGTHCQLASGWDNFTTRVYGPVAVMLSTLLGKKEASSETGARSQLSE